MARPHTKTRGWEVAFFGLLFAVYVGFFPYIGAINNPNENVRTYMTMALVEQGSFKIDAIVERHGWTNYMARAPDKKTGVFHLYSVKAPAVSYAGVPVYWAFTKVMPKLGRPVPTAASHPDEKAKWLADSTWALRIFSVQIPAVQSSTSLLVPKQQLTRVAGLNQALQGATMIATPPLSAFLLSVLPIHLILGIDVLTAVVAIAILFFVFIPQPSTRQSITRIPTNVWQDLRAGFTFIKQWPALVNIMIIAALINLVLTPASSSSRSWSLSVFMARLFNWAGSTPPTDLAP